MSEDELERYFWVRSPREGFLAPWHMPSSIAPEATFTACGRRFEPDVRLTRLFVNEIRGSERCPTCQGAFAMMSAGKPQGALDAAMDLGYQEVADRIDRGELEPTSERLEMLERWRDRQQ